MCTPFDLKKCSNKEEELIAQDHFGAITIRKQNIP
jgi:hypothetical protein